MKKSILILSAIAGMTYLTSCGDDAKPTDATMTQAQLDSIAKVQADSAALANAAVNDSLLRAQQDSLALVAQADSIAAAAAAKKGTTVKKTSKPSNTGKPTTTKPTAPVIKEPTKTGGMRGNSDQAKEANKGNSEMRGKSDQAKEANKGNSGMRGKSDQSK